VADWIFFDCFNTLIDDFDATGDESGLGSLDLDIEPSRALGMRPIHLNRGADRPHEPATPAGVASIQHWREFR
jgi:FMN phosphatase YigB (HAD superfamily)